MNVSSRACVVVWHFAAIVLMGASTGCSTVGIDKSIADLGGVGGRITNAGPNQLAGLDAELNLPKILYAKASPEMKIDEALRRFYESHQSDWEEWRDRIQDRILGASEERCNTYKIYLKNFDSETKSIFGIATTILAGAGAIATGTVNSRALSGLAAITSGSGAEITSAVFANVATHILIPGIDARRDDVRKAIEAKRARLGEKYTMEAALLDAARFHGACTLDTGLRAASDSVNEVQNVGVRRMNEVLKMAAETKTNLEAAARGEGVRQISGSVGSTATLYGNSGTGPIGDQGQSPMQELQDAIADLIKRLRDAEIAASQRILVQNEVIIGFQGIDDDIKAAAGRRKALVSEKEALEKNLSPGPGDQDKIKQIAADLSGLDISLKALAEKRDALQADKAMAADKKSRLADNGFISDRGVHNPILTARDKLIAQLKAQAPTFANLATTTEQARQAARGTPERRERAFAVEQALLEYEAERVKLRRFLFRTYAALRTAADQIAADQFDQAKKTFDDVGTITY